MAYRYEMELYFYDDLGSPILCWRSVKVEALAHWDWPEIIAEALRLHPELDGYASVWAGPISQVA